MRKLLKLSGVRILMFINILALALSNVVVPVSAAQKREFCYVGADYEACGDWEGKYGTLDYVLVGYKSYSLSPVQSLIKGDYIESFEMKPDAIYAGNYGYVGTAQTILKMPSGTQETPNTAYQVYADQNGSNGGKSSYFTFNVVGDEHKIFSIYGISNEKNVTFRFTDITTGEVLYERTFDENPFVNKEKNLMGGYVSFVTSGSFRLEMEYSAWTSSGPSGFFFDNLNQAPTEKFSADEKENELKNTVSWTENSFDKVFVQRNTKSDDTGFETIYEAGRDVVEYNDESVVTNLTYQYRLISKNENGYEITEIDEVKMPDFKELELVFSETSYSEYRDKNLTIVLRVFDSNKKPVGNVKVAVEYEGETVGEKYSESLGYFTTDENGYINITECYRFVGKYTMTATTYADFEREFATSVKAVPLEIMEYPYAEPPAILKLSDAISGDQVISISGNGMMGRLEVRASAFNGYDKQTNTPSADSFALDILQNDIKYGYYVQCQMPKGTPGGLYNIWVRNEYGWSKPSVLNEARFLYQSEYEVWAGLTIDISGRNLSGEQFGSNAQTDVRLNDDNGSIYYMDVTKVTPYSIAFKIPDEVRINRTYTVEVTNNGGLSWVRPQSKQTLTVLPVGNDPLGIGFSWLDHFNWDQKADITDFGATGNDKTNDTEAIKKTIDSVKSLGGGVVYMPEGEYYVSQIKLPAEIVLMGAGKDKTILYYDNENSTEFIVSADDGTTIGHSGVHGFTMKNVTERLPSTNIWYGIPWSDSVNHTYMRTPDEFFISNIKIDMPVLGDSNNGVCNGAMTFMDSRFVVVENEFHGIRGGIPLVNNNYYCYMRDNYFNYSSSYVSATAEYAFIFNSVIEAPINTVGDDAITDHTHGFFARSNAHIENCKTYYTGHWGDGEAYCAETPGMVMRHGRVKSVDGKTITLAPFGTGEDSTTRQISHLVVLITAGKGMGQCKDIADYVPGESITIADDWDIVPDATSYCAVLLTNANFTVYDCYAEEANTSACIYGNIYDTVVAKLNVKNSGGVEIFEAKCPDYFIVIRDCEKQGHSPFRCDQSNYVNSRRGYLNGFFEGTDIYGVEFRNNSYITSAEFDVYGVQSKGSSIYRRESGIALDSARESSSDPLDDETDMLNVIIENNHIEGYQYGVSIGYRTGGVLVKGNTFKDIVKKNIYEYPNSVNYNITEIDEKSEQADRSLDYPTVDRTNIVGDERFTDLSGFDWAENAIYSLYTDGILNGDSESTFNPSGKLTRAEFFKVIAEIAGFDTLAYKGMFKDVSKSDWFADYIQIVYTNGLINDEFTENSCLKPNTPITREEAATVLANLYKLQKHGHWQPTIDYKLADMEDISEWCAESAELMIGYGIFKGDENKRFRPHDSLTRAEAAVISKRFIKDLKLIYA